MIFIVNNFIDFFNEIFMKQKDLLPSDMHLTARGLNQSIYI